MPKKDRSLLKNMKFSEVSLVDRGANAGADVSIFKMAKPEVIFKETFDEALEEMDLGEGIHEIFEKLSTYKSALRSAIWSVFYNDSVIDKKQAIKESLGQFMLAMASLVEDSEVLKQLGEGTKDLEVKKTFDEPESEVILAELIKEYNTIFPDNPISNVRKSQEERTMEKKELDILKTLAGLSDVQKAYWAGLTDAEQDTLLAKSLKDRVIDIDKGSIAKAKAIEKARKNDETFEMDGQVICKSDVGDAAFLMMKSMNKRIEKSEAETADAQKIAKEEKQARIEKEMAVEAETLWPNLPGTPIEKGKTLAAIRALPEEQQGAQMAMLKSGNDNTAELFKERGTSNVSDGTDPLGKLDALAKTYATEHKISFSKAYADVMETPEGKALYEDSLG